MVRAPCCEKMGLKKGPWTPEEDEILISYIQQNGHSNWRALPKQAGLLRCGKSCRLRWINYLRPDIKRGNFSKEEEETIMKLHEMLGNRWSAISAKLPGRTDNEIKNVWHTRLKKKLLRDNYQKGRPVALPVFDSNSSRESNSVYSSFPTQPGVEIPVSSPQDSSSDHSSVTDLSVLPHNVMVQTMDTSGTLPRIDENFRSGEILTENFINYQSDFPSVGDELQFPLPFSPVRISTTSTETTSKDFWYNLFIGAGGLPAEF